MVIDQPVINEASLQAKHSERPAERDMVESAMRRYVATAFAIMTALYLLPFGLVRTGVYQRHNPSFYAQPLNYAYKTAGANADVIIFGDSTALLGIDPSLMSAQLGAKVLNLVNTQPSLVVNDDLTLRRYLAKNRAPRLIVFYFAPWDFDYGHTDFNSRPVYEGVEVLFTQGTANELMHFIIKRPMAALQFPLRFYASYKEFMLHREPHPDEDAQLAATLGHVDTIDPTVMPSSCRFPQLLLDNVRFDWVRSLGARFGTAETKVMFYVAPVPSCSNVSAVLNRPYDQLPATPPKAVAPEAFTNDIRYIHPRPASVPLLSRSLADAVRPLLQSSQENVASAYKR